MRIYPFVLGVAVAACGFRSSIDSSDREPPAADVLAEDTYDFGVVDCGSSAGPRFARVVNSSSRDDADPLTWQADVEGPFHLVGTRAGVLERSSTAFIGVAPDNVSTPSAGDELRGTLSIRTNDPGHPITEIPLRLSSRGGVLDAPTAETFSLLTPFAATKILSFSNRGNAPIDVKVGSPSLPDFVVQSASFKGNGFDAVMHLAPNDTDKATIHFDTYFSGPRIGALPFEVIGPVCGKLPPPIKLIGNGVDGPLAITGSLDFGKVQCGQKLAPRAVKLTNITASAVSFGITQGKGWAAVIQPTSGSLAPGESVDVQVTPSQIPSKYALFGYPYYDAELLLKANNATYVLSIHEEPWGAVLSQLATTVGVSAANSGSFVAVSVRNSGNEPVRVSASLPGFQIYAQTVPVGDSTLNVQFFPPTTEVGAGVTRVVPLTLEGDGPFCGPAEIELRYRPYLAATAIAANATGFCIASTNVLYCEGTNSLLGMGYPIGFHWLSQASVGQASDVVMASDGTCWTGWTGWTCAASNQSTTVQMALPYGGLFASSGAFHACLDSGSSFGCIGTNAEGQWGNGASSSSFVTSPTLAMGGQTGVQSYAGSDLAGYAVRSGTIFAAGTKVGGNLGTSSVPDGPVTFPVTVDGISDALVVSAFSDGACAARASGGVSCWNTSHPTPTDRGAFADAISVTALAYDDFCVRRANGTASCWNGSAVVPLVGMAPPIRRLAMRSGLVYAVDGNSVAWRGPTSWNYHQAIVGFDGP